MVTTLAPGIPGVVVQWCAVDTVANDERVKAATLPDGVTVADCVQAASEELFKFSGSRWCGLRTDVVRPHRLNDDGTDLGSIAWGFGGWGWTGAGGMWDRFFPEGWGAGAFNSNELPLPGPVTRIIEVKVDGAVLDASLYQLFDNRRLVRLADPDTGAYLSWPSGQRLSVPTTEENTFSVEFEHGQAPPMSGVLASREWSIQKVLFVSTNRTKLPQRAQSVQRQGVNITIEQGDQLKEGKVGIPLVDSFLQAFNPGQLRRRARSYSPDSISDAIVSTKQ